MTSGYVTLPLHRLVVGQPIPASVFVQVDGRYLRLRKGGEVFDRALYDKFHLKNIPHLYVLAPDLPKFVAWADFQTLVAGPPGAQGEAQSEFLAAWKDAHRKAFDIFTRPQSNGQVAEGIVASLKLVSEIMKRPYVIVPLNQLQSFSRGTVDHSVNVSVLATYLAMQMGYAHTPSLENIAAGALLHDLGKREVLLNGENEDPAAAASQMRDHARIGGRMIERMPEVPVEVRLIVEQHHEFHDGSGYPRQLRGDQIFDLARVVTIANEFDDLVASGQGPLHERQQRAVKIFDEKFMRKIEGDKHERAFSILTLGL